MGIGWIIPRLHQGNGWIVLEYSVIYHEQNLIQAPGGKENNKRQNDLIVYDSHLAIRLWLTAVH